MQFEKFPKIEQYKRVPKMLITQKLHGTNAQVAIFKDEEGNTQVKAGSRNRWLTVEKDNYGFAAWVTANKEALIEYLGEGRHYGEWVGPGIHNGEGLEERTFVLFNHWLHHSDKPLPKNVLIVPVLWDGEYREEIINAVMDDLKTNGSRLVEGHMAVEGVVINALGSRFKKVFDPEDTQWDKVKKAPKADVAHYDAAHLMQPIRLEKLLTKDEEYVRNYPKSLVEIVSEYSKDLIEENQITEGDYTLNRRSISKQLFGFVREYMSLKGKEENYAKK